MLTNNCCLFGVILSGGLLIVLLGSLPTNCLAVKKRQASSGSRDCGNSGPCSRPAVYWPDKNRCYTIFEQGPCPKGQWVVPNKDKGPKCKDIPCPKAYKAQESKPIQGPSIFLFSYKGKCYTAGVPNKGPCSQNELATIFVNEFVCTSSPYGCGYHLPGGSPPDCLAGTVLGPDKRTCEKQTRL